MKAWHIGRKMVIHRKGEDMSDNNLNDMPEGMDAGSTGQYGQEQFGQQVSGQYGQQFDSMAQNSMYDQTVNMYGDQAHRPETPQKQKGIKIAIIAVVAALVVIAALVVVFLVFVKKTPKEAVKSAMENTAKELENNNIAGVIGIDDIDADKLDVQSQFSIDKVNGADQLSGAEFVVNGYTAFDDDNNSLMLDGSATLAGETVTSQIIMMGQKIYLSSPELFNKTFVYDVNSVLEELDAAEAGQGGAVDSEALDKIIKEDLKPATDKLADAVLYERVGKNEFTDANGKTVKAEQYTVTITTDAIDDYANSIADCLNKYVDSNISDDMLTQMGVTKAQLTQVIGTIPSLVGAVVTKDIVVNVYVDHNKVVHVDFDYDIAAAGVKLTFTTDNMGDGDVTSDTKSVVSLTYGTDTSIVLDCTRKSDTDGDKQSSTGEYDLTASYGGETQTMSFKVSSSYDKSSGAIEAGVSADVDDESVDAAFAGTLADVKKGKSFSIEDAKLSLSVSGEDYFECSGKISVAEKENKIEAPVDSDVVDYSVLNSDEAEKYINTESAEKIMSAWNELFDSISIEDKLGTGDSDEPDIEEDTQTEADTQADDVDYSGQVIKMGDSQVKINDPEGYERSYASEYTISLNDKAGEIYVSYSAYEGYDASELIKSMKDTYTEYYNDENSKVNDMQDGTVKAKDGTKVSYLVTQLTSYDTDRTEVTLVYPSGDNIVGCSVSYWQAAKDVDVQKLCDKFIDAIEIK